MIRQSLFLTLGLMAALTLGCEKKESAPATSDTAEEAAETADDTAKEVEEAAEDIKKAAEDIEVPGQ